MASTPGPDDGAPAVSARDRIGQRPLVDKAITRALSDQYATAAQEVDRIIEATYRVIEREGTVDPRIRDILDESGLATQAFYRHFKSKDELLLVLLDDGRRKLAQYLLHRMEKAEDPVSSVTAWIEGIMAQAANPDAASRTRPFILGLQRLSERYAEEQLASVQLLLELLQPAIVAGVSEGRFAALDPTLASTYIYDVAVTVMEDHVVRGVKPSRRETAELVAFCLRGLGVSP
jgi:AcrR family transcriptional regulator